MDYNDEDEGFIQLYNSLTEAERYSIDNDLPMWAANAVVAARRVIGRAKNIRWKIRQLMRGSSPTDDIPF